MSEFAAWIDRLQRENSILIEVKVTPRAAKREISGFTTDGALKVKLTAVPEKGKANEELRELLAEYFRVAKSKVEVVSGETSRHKRVRVSK